jgi:hypothetical protein
LAPFAGADFLAALVAFFAAAIVLDDCCDRNDREKKHCASPALRAEIISVLLSVNQSIVSFFHFSVTVNLTIRTNELSFTVFL